MLTKLDLKQIGGVLSKGIKKEVKPLRSDMLQISKIVKTSEKRLDRKMERIDRKLDKAINFLDRDYIRLLERVERIEKHLQLSPVS